MFPTAGSKTEHAPAAYTTAEPTNLIDSGQRIDKIFVRCRACESLVLRGYVVPSTAVMRSGHVSLV